MAATVSEAARGCMSTNGCICKLHVSRVSHVSTPHDRRPGSRFRMAPLRAAVVIRRKGREPSLSHHLSGCDSLLRYHHILILLFARVHGRFNSHSPPLMPAGRTRGGRLVLAFRELDDVPRDAAGDVHGMRLSGIGSNSLVVTIVAWSRNGHPCRHWLLGGGGSSRLALRTVIESNRGWPG